MPLVRVVDVSGRLDPWRRVLEDVLTSAGYDLVDDGDTEAQLTIVIHPDGSPPDEGAYAGDLLVLGIPRRGGEAAADSRRTEVVGSHRLKARHLLSTTAADSSIAEELRLVVNLFAS